jgi:hypothetical protein
MLAAAMLAVGCGKGSGLVPVSGRVMLDGQPVKQMVVTFTPVGDTPGLGALGHTGDDGHFTLTDARGETGAYVGEYKVYFYPGAAGAKTDDPGVDVVTPPRRTNVPAIYLDGNQTPLRAKVPPGGGTIEVILTKSGKGATTKTTPKGEGG